jgi:DNA-binding LacI/PurR family transcriptional regulator
VSAGDVRRGAEQSRAREDAPSPSVWRPSMADVARMSGVSAQTVSRYFTGSGYVGAETRDRIREAVEHLDYRPNRSARNLRTRRSDTIGILAVGPLIHGMADTLTGLSQAARAAAFPVVIAHLDVAADDPGAASEIRRAVDFFLSAPMDGIVVTSPYLGVEELLDDVPDVVPVVTVSGRPTRPKDAVYADSYAAGTLATTHLVGLGHERLLHLGGPADRNEAFDRARGYRDVLQAHGLDPLPVVRGDWGPSSGFAVGRMVDPATFSAVFAGNDQMALGFMSALRARGFVAPRDYSIVGVDDMPDAQFFDPPLTSVVMDFKRVGAEAFRLVYERIHGVPPQDQLVVPPRLAVRASTAPRR